MKCILKEKNVNILRQQWCRLLNRYKWTYFLTLNFRDIPQTFTAQNRAKYFLRYIEETVKHKIAYFIAMEKTKVGTPHFHLLLGNLGWTRYTEWSKWWYARYGYSKFKVYDPKKGATHYLTKYVIKDNYQSGWYDIQALEQMNQVIFDEKNR